VCFWGSKGCFRFLVDFLVTSRFGWISAKGVSIEGVSIEGVSIEGVSIEGVSIEGVSIEGVSIEGVAFEGCVFLLAFFAWVLAGWVDFTGEIVLVARFFLGSALVWPMFDFALGCVFCFVSFFFLCGVFLKGRFLGGGRYSAMLLDGGMVGSGLFSSMAKVSGGKAGVW
jgi:hypothetical protein